MGPPGALPSGSGLPGMQARRGPPGKLGGMSLGGMMGPPTDAFGNFGKVV